MERFRLHEQLVADLLGIVVRPTTRPLPWQELPAFMAELAKVDGMGAAAFRFAILTAARTGEVGVPLPIRFERPAAGVVRPPVHLEPDAVVDESFISPGGREPLSEASSHS